MTRARVHYHPAFVTDLRAHKDWIVEHDRPAWLDALATGLNAAAALLADYPMVGPVVAEGRDTTLRRLVWSHAPYVCWYVHRQDPPIPDVWLIRLFHASQRRPAPDVRFWAAEIESARE